MSFVMRSLWRRLEQFLRKDDCGRTASRTETLRRQSIFDTARITVMICIVGMPIAVVWLALGEILPIIIGALGLTSAWAALAYCRRGSFERAAALLVYGTMITGTLLSVVDPAVADLGLAILLIGPVQAALLARTPVKKRAWALLVAAVAVIGLSIATPFGWPEPFSFNLGLLSTLGFIVASVTLMIAASRMGSAFEVLEKGQINAYRHLIEHVQDAVIRFGSDGSLMFCSRTTEKLFGCRRFQLLGDGLIERIHVLDRPAYMTAFAEANQDGQSRRVEIRMLREDPEAPSPIPQYIWVEIALSPVVDPALGDVRHEVVALLRDVTERRDREAELLRARRAAEEASLAKTRFLATIGHELRTPLNAIVGFSEMMASGVVGELSAPHREYVNLINESGQHLLEVVKALLDMSRIESGRFELITEPFAPELLVEPCLRMVDQMARERQIRLMTDIPKSLPMIVADERALRQVLINLLSNAIKFSNDRSVVTVAMRRQGKHLLLSVSDSGIGMGDEILRRLGEPFFQAQDGLARGYEGTGLGLSIVKGIVDLHQGTLQASSVPGEGTVITVLLPINGPETKVVETPTVTPLLRDSGSQTATWHADERKRAL